MANAQNTIFITANGETRSVTLNDNSATTALRELLGQGPVVVSMSDYGGFEKVGALPRSLPASDKHITTVPGDIMLYQGNQMVIFYGSNSWSYTPLGKIDNATSAGVKAFLGSGTVDVTLSLTASAGACDATADADTPLIVYDLQGTIVDHRPLAPGIYIIGGKKVAVRRQ